VVRRQQERDVAVLLPTIRHLTERQYQLFFLFHTLIARHVTEGFARVVDDDVADAAGALAATLETAARGVIYDHPPQSLVAQRLVTEMKAMLAQMKQEGATVYDHEASVVLRAIEQGARAIGNGASPTGAESRVVGDTAYLDLVGRLLQVNRQPEPVAAPQTSSSLILP
jgi:hypothetical protein